MNACGSHVSMVDSFLPLIGATQPHFGPVAQSFPSALDHGRRSLTLLSRLGGEVSFRAMPGGGERRVGVALRWFQPTRLGFLGGEAM